MRPTSSLTRVVRLPLRTATALAPFAARGRASAQLLTPPSPRAIRVLAATRSSRSRPIPAILFLIFFDRGDKILLDALATHRLPCSLIWGQAS